MQHPRPTPASRGAAPASAGRRPIGYACVGSPVGTVWVAAGEGGVRRVSLGSLDEAAFRRDLLARWPAEEAVRDERHPVLADALRQLADYFSGARRSFSVPVDLTGLTPFARRVLDAVRDVPCGSVVSYGEIARALGRPGAARAVGGALSRNPVPVLVPCHRVVAGDGRIGGFTVGGDATSVGTKRRLLALEGTGTSW